MTFSVASPQPYVGVTVIHDGMPVSTHVELAETLTTAESSLLERASLLTARLMQSSLASSHEEMKSEPKRMGAARK